MVGALFSGLVLVVLTIVIGFLIYGIRKTKRKLQLIEDTPLTDVEDLESGMGKVNGVAVALDEELTSPMTQVDCIYYQFIVEELRTRTTRRKDGSTTTHNYWHTIIDDKDAIDCAVEDDTGRAEMELLDAELVLRTKAHMQSGLFDDCPRDLERLLRKRYGRSSQGLIFNKSMRYTETVIREGDDLFVLGPVKCKKGKDPYFSKGDEPFIVSDKDEREVVAHFNTRLTWYYVFTGMAAAVFLAATGYLIFDLVKGEDKTPMVNNPLPNTTDGDKDKGQPADPVQTALTKMRSPKPEERRAGTWELARANADDTRRDEVLAAVAMARQDSDDQVKSAAQFAYDKWKRPEVVVDPNKDRPIDPNKDKPPEKDALAKLLDDLGSFDKATRQRAAEALGEMAPIAGRKTGVLQALQSRLTDGDRKIAAAAGHAYKVWEGTVPPGKFEDPLLDPSGPVEWTAKADPLTTKPYGALNAKAKPVVLQGGGTIVQPTSVHAAAVLATPPNAPNTIQAIEMRQLKGVGTPVAVKFDAFNYKQPVVSPDGAYLAGITPNASKPTVEIWSTATGKVVSKIEIDAVPDTWVRDMDFLSGDRLLIGTQSSIFAKENGPASYHVCEVKSGLRVGTFDFNQYMHSRWTALSPGGNYLALGYTDAEGYQLVLIDLTAGRLAGKIEAVPKQEAGGQVAGVAFGPEGDKLALLWRVGQAQSWGRLLCWDLNTQKKVYEHTLGTEAADVDGHWQDGGRKNLQWLPDGSGWLLFSQVLVDAESGAAWKFGAPPKVTVVHRRFLDRDHTSLILSENGTTALDLETIPWAKIEPEFKKAREAKGAKEPDKAPPDKAPPDNPDKPEEPKPEKRVEEREKPGGKTIEAPEWAVKADPPGPKPEFGAADLRANYPIQRMAPLVYSLSDHAGAMATTTSAGVIQVVDLRMLKEVGKPLKGKYDWLGTKYTAVSPDGKLFAQVPPKAEKPTVELWSSATGELERKLEIEADPKMRVHAAVFTANDRLLTVLHASAFPLADAEGIYQVWDLKTGKEVTRFTFDLYLSPRWSAVSPGGKYLALEVYEDGYWIVVLDLTTGKVAGKMRLQEKKVPWGDAAAMAFSPDGTKLAVLWRVITPDSWGHLICWDVATQKKDHDIPLGNDPVNIDQVWMEGALKDLQWVPDGSGWLLFGHVLIDAEAERVVWHFGGKPQPHNAYSYRRFLDRDHMTAVTEGSERKLIVERVPWDKITPEIKKERLNKGKPQESPATAAVEWTVRPDPVVQKPQFGEVNPRGSYPVQNLGTLLYSDAPHALALATQPPKTKDVLQLVDLRSVKEVGKPIKAAFEWSKVKHVAVSADGKYVAAATPKADPPAVEIWSSETGEVVRRVEINAGQNQWVQGLTFLGPEQLLTVVQTGERAPAEAHAIYHVWDVKTGKEVATFTHETRMHPKWSAVSPGGKYLAMQQTNTLGFFVLFWDLTTGKPAGKIQMQGPKDPWGESATLAFSPDGTKLALLWHLGKRPQSWGKLLCWDLKTQKKVQEVPLGYDPQSIEGLWAEGGTKTMQWVPDGSGWLLFGHLLLDAELGRVVWRFGADPKSDTAPSRRRFLDRDHMSALTDGLHRNLTIETVPWDKIDPEVKKAREKK